MVRRIRMRRLGHQRTRWAGLLALALVSLLPMTGAGAGPAASVAPTPSVTCGEAGHWDPPQPTVSCAAAIVAAARVLPPDAIDPVAITFAYGLPCPDRTPCPLPLPVHGFVRFELGHGPNLVVRVTLDPDTGVVTAESPEPWPQVSAAPSFTVGFDGHPFTGLPVSVPAGSSISITAVGPDGVVVELLRRDDGITTPWTQIMADAISQPASITVPAQPVVVGAGQTAERALPLDTPGSYLLAGYTVPPLDASGERPYPSIGCVELTVTRPGMSPGPLPSPAASPAPPICVPKPVPPEMTPSPGPS